MRPCSATIFKIAKSNGLTSAAGTGWPPRPGNRQYASFQTHKLVERPIEQVFAKLKALLRRAAPRSFDAIVALKHILERFSPAECANYLRPSEYVQTGAKMTLVRILNQKMRPKNPSISQRHAAQTLPIAARSSNVIPNEKGGPLPDRPFEFERETLNASRTGSCGVPWRGRTSCARRCGCRGSGSRLP